MVFNEYTNILEVITYEEFLEIASKNINYVDNEYLEITQDCELNLIKLLEHYNLDYVFVNEKLELTNETLQELKTLWINDLVDNKLEGTYFYSFLSDIKNYYEDNFFNEELINYSNNLANYLQINYYSLLLDTYIYGENYLLCFWNWNQKSDFEKTKLNWLSIDRDFLNFLEKRGDL